MRWLGRLIDVRPEERMRVTMMFSLLGLIIATSYILKPVRSSLFLAQFGSARLPYVYILVAIVLGAVAWLFAKWAPSARLSSLFQRTAYFFAFNLALFWLALAAGWAWTGFVFYVWVSIFTALMPSLFWLFANYVFYSNEGRRLFPIVTAGGLLGSILGGTMTSVLVAYVGTRGLLVTAMGLLITIALLVRKSAHQERARMSERSAELTREERTLSGRKDQSPWALVKDSRYVSLLASLIFLTTLCSTLVDYQFNTVVEGAFESVDALTGFFGTFFAGINVAAFLLQVFLVGRLLGRFGVGAGLLLLPASLLASSIGFLAAPRLLTATFIKSADDGLSNSVHKSGIEVLYLPIGLAIKNRLKAWLDMFVERTSRGVAGLAILVATQVLSLSVSRVSLLVIVLLVPWFAVIVALRREYLNTLRESLAKRDVADLASALRDEASLSVVREMLRGDEPKELAYALEIVEGVDDAAILERALQLSSHADAAVRANALRLLRSSAAVPAITDFATRIRDSDPGAAAEAVALWVQLEPERGLHALRDYMVGSDIKRLDAVLDAVNVTGEVVDEPDLKAFIDSRWDAQDWTSRRLAAKAVGILTPGSPLRTRLDVLVHDPVIDVARAAATSMGRLRYASGFDALVRSLARRPLRAAARRAIGQLGPGTVERVAKILGDDSAERDVLVALPLVLAEFDDPRAVAALFEALPNEDPHLDFQGVKALGKLRARFSGLRFSRREVDRLLGVYSRGLSELSNQHCGMASGDMAHPSRALLARALEERVERSREILFRLLGLLYPPIEIKNAAFRIENGQPAVRAAALEFLNTVLSTEHRGSLYPLIEAATPDQMAAAGRELYGNAALDFETALKALITHRDDWLTASAVTVIGKLKIEPLRGQLASMREHPSVVVREAVEAAL